ncbi:MAG: hypothetical protein ACOYM5_06220 [Caulobacter sp.]
MIASRISTYWKRGQMYGRELTLTVRGPMNLMTRTQFNKTLSTLPGVTAPPVQRASSGEETEYTVSYSGTVPIDQALAEALSGNPQFANLDSRTESGRVLLCMGPCPAGH